MEESFPKNITWWGAAVFENRVKQFQKIYLWLSETKIILAYTQFTLLS